MTSGKIAALLGSLVLSSVAIAAPVLAHTDLKESSPLDGQTMRHTIDNVELVFWSPFSDPAIEVLGPDGNSIEGRTAQVDDITVRFGMDPLTDDGEYTVRYQIRSNDGDVSSGTVAFRFAPTSAGQNGTRIGLVVALAIVALVWWVFGRARVAGSNHDDRRISRGDEPTF